MPHPIRCLAALCLSTVLWACGPSTRLHVGPPPSTPAGVAFRFGLEERMDPVEQRAGQNRPADPTTTTTVETVPPAGRVQAVARPAPAPPQPTRAAQPADVDGMPRTLRRIGGCESGNGPDGPIDWTAQNRGSSASGGFQDLDSTYQRWAARFRNAVIDETGEDPTQWARAMQAPAEVQLKVNLHAFLEDGPGAWSASKMCWQ